MANYFGRARTNYVTVQDIAGLKKALEPWPISVEEKDGKVVLLDDDPDGSGWPTWGFGTDGEDLELDVADVIMPFVAEGEVLVLEETGHEKMRYLTGYACAWIRRGEAVDEVNLNLSMIYQMAADKFGVPVTDITEATY